MRFNRNRHAFLCCARCHRGSFTSSNRVRHAFTHRDRYTHPYRGYYCPANGHAYSPANRDIPAYRHAYPHPNRDSPAN